MKKKHTLNFFLICLLLSLKLSAQLSGVYTINGSAPVSSTNFTSFTTFAAAVTASTITGPVTVNVATAIYTEQVTFTQGAGISATNSITINGNGATLTFNGGTSVAPNTLLLTGADYMFFNNLTVIGANITNAYAVHISNSGGTAPGNPANNNYFTNCTFQADIATNSYNTAAFSISGGDASYSANTLSGGSNNTINGCTFIGGYWGLVIYGMSTTPFSTTGNMIINSSLRDQFLTPIWVKDCPGTTIKNNTTENINRTVMGTSSHYGIYYGTNCTSMLVDGNRVRNPFFGFTSPSPASNGDFTGIYAFSPGAAGTGSDNVISNNVISNIGNSLGAIIGIDLRGAYTSVFHNTISLDDINAVAATGATGIITAAASNQCKIKNNIVTISRGGTGTKRCYNYTTVGTGFQSDYNVASITSIAGVNSAITTSTSSYPTFYALNAGNPSLLIDFNSKDADPLYTNPAALNFVPTSTLINNMCLSVGVLTDNSGVVRSTTSPDPGAFETFTLPCSGTPSTNSIAALPAQCPNAYVNLALANNLGSAGYNIQWQSAPALSGPYTPIAGAITAFYNTNTVTTTTYYNALISCGSGSTITATPGSIQIAGITINNVPYNEDFEGITKPNRLPNCSWSATSSYTSTLTYTTLASNNRIPHSGTKFASFYSTPTGTNAFYTNGINLVAGVTYSAGLYYINEQVNYNNWADFSVLIGTSQSSTGLISIASTSASAVSYSLLSGTFTVAASGVYYIAVRATTAPGNSPYLTWDDLFINIPCSLNSPTVTLNATGSSTICQGDNKVLTAAGADTYTWNTTSNLPQITVAPSINTLYTVVGTSSLSGCSNTTTQFINVNPTPQVFIFTGNTVICQGQTITLTAQGANIYNWSTGALLQSIIVSPSVSASYTATGANAYGCTNSQSIAITVNPKPLVLAGASQTMVCKGEPVTFTASGAPSYVWTSASLYTLTTTGSMSITAQSSAAYTVTGTNTTGCAASAFFVLNVNDCTGINEPKNDRNGIHIYPNPNNGEFFITSNESDIKAVEIYDATGKIVYAANTVEADKVNISEMPNGVYSAKVITVENVIQYFKIVKTQ